MLCKTFSEVTTCLLCYRQGTVKCISCIIFPVLFEHSYIYAEKQFRLCNKTFHRHMSVMLSRPDPLQFTKECGYARLIWHEEQQAYCLKCQKSVHPGVTLTATFMKCLKEAFVVFLAVLLVNPKGRQLHSGLIIGLTWACKRADGISYYNIYPVWLLTYAMSWYQTL